jgi:hypothetical protein
MNFKKLVVKEFDMYYCGWLLLDGRIVLTNYGSRYVVSENEWLKYKKTIK